jgi:hypothetical protein
MYFCILEWFDLHVFVCDKCGKPTSKIHSDSPKAVFSTHNRYDECEEFEGHPAVQVQLFHLDKRMNRILDECVQFRRRSIRKLPACLSPLNGWTKL